MTHPTTPDGRRYGVYCVSSGRPANVPAMASLMLPDPITWVVPHAERHDYKTAGAHAVLPVRPPEPGHSQLTTQRQAALTHAMESGAVCIQTDDDAKGFKFIPADGSGASPAAWAHIRNALLAALDGTVHLAGLPPTDNAFFARGRQLDYGFVLASLHATDTADPGWDTRLPVKEDYDYTCRHLETYGRIARLDTLLASYDHYSNRGGAVAVRTPEIEAETAAFLTARWPQYLKDHATRRGELAFIPQNRKSTTR